MSSARSNVDGSAVLALLRKDLVGVTITVIEREFIKFGLDVTNLAKRNAPVKTGRLRRSIQPEVFREGGKVTGVVGTNVVYGARIEKGFMGAEDVRSFTRRQTMVFGKPITPQIVSVKAFTRQANTPANPYLGPALAAASPPLQDRVNAAMRNVPGVNSK